MPTVCRIATRSSRLRPARNCDDVVIAEIARQPRIDAGDIGRHAVEEVDAGTAQQRIQDRLVDFGRPVSRRQRRNVFAGAGLDLRADTGGVQAERGLEAGMRQIELARDQQRAPQFRRPSLPATDAAACRTILAPETRRWRPIALPLPSTSISTRTKACGVALMTTAPNRNGRAKVTGRSKKAMSSTAKRSGIEASSQSSALWVKKCLRMRCTSSVKAGSAIASSERGRGSGTS